MSRKSLKVRAGQALEQMTPEEDRAITEAAIADPDNPPLDDDFFRTARRGRGPQKAPTKQLVSLRLDKDVLVALRSTGKGWQSRANEELRKVFVGK